MTDKTQNTSSEAAKTTKPATKILSPAAKRALMEAEERRNQTKIAQQENEREVGGRGGEDPARYGDWEINGRAIDF